MNRQRQRAKEEKYIQAILFNSLSSSPYIAAGRTIVAIGNALFTASSPSAFVLRNSDSELAFAFR
jgi:hypothetical protein